MKRIVLCCSLLMAISFGTWSQSLDTIFKYPLLYYGDLGWTNGLDDTLCAMMPSGIYPIGRGAIEGNVMYSMHADDTLHIVGIAYTGIHSGYTWNCEHTLYDSNKNVLKTASSTCVPYIEGQPFLPEQLRLYVPGFPTYVSVGWINPNIMTLAYFDDSSKVDIVGDFYMTSRGSRGVDSPLRPLKVYALIERHDPPYHFPPVDYFEYDEDSKEWEERVGTEVIPMIFPIIEPRCYEVGSVGVSVDSIGCVSATWDTLLRQSQWVVSYGPEGMAPEGYDTVDTAYWQRCDLQPGTRYTLAVRSRCTNLNTYSWSPWSAAATVETPSQGGINDITGAPAFTLTPNPTTGRVTVTLEAPAEAGVTMELYDSEGRRVATYAVAAGATEQTLDLAALSAGVYHLRMLTPQGMATRRLIVR